MGIMSGNGDADQWGADNIQNGRTGLGNTAHILTGAGGGPTKGPSQSDFGSQINGATSDANNLKGLASGFHQSTPQINNQFQSDSRAGIASNESNQGDLAGYYQGIMSGKGHTAAQDQFQSATDQGIAAQMAMAHSGPGGAIGQAGASRAAAQQGAITQAGAAAQSGAIRARESADAAQGQAGVYSNIGQQRQSQYGMEQGSAMHQADLGSANQAQQNAQQLGLYGLGQHAADRSLQGLNDFTTAGINAQKIQSEKDAEASKEGSGLLSGTMSALGSAAGALSDARVKTGTRNEGKGLIAQLFGPSDTKESDDKWDRSGFGGGLFFGGRHDPEPMKESGSDWAQGGPGRYDPSMHLPGDSAELHKSSYESQPTAVIGAPDRQMPANTQGFMGAFGAGPKAGRLGDGTAALGGTPDLASSDVNAKMQAHSEGFQNGIAAGGRIAGQGHMPGAAPPLQGAFGGGSNAPAVANQAQGIMSVQPQALQGTTSQQAPQTSSYPAPAATPMAAAQGPAAYTPTPPMQSATVAPLAASPASAPSSVMSATASAPQAAVTPLKPPTANAGSVMSGAMMSDAAAKTAVAPEGRPTDAQLVASAGTGKSGIMGDTPPDIGVSGASSSDSGNRDAVSDDEDKPPPVDQKPPPVSASNPGIGPDGRYIGRYGPQKPSVISPGSWNGPRDINEMIRQDNADGDAIAHGDFSSMAAPTFASDKELKKGIGKPTLADKFMDGLHPASYKYKDPQDEPGIVPNGGRYLGIMAQDAEKIPEIGHQLVVNTPRGKMVAQKPMLSAAVAGLARLNERMRVLEAEKGKRA